MLRRRGDLAVTIVDDYTVKLVLPAPDITIVVGMAAEHFIAEGNGILKAIVVGETAAGAINVTDATGTIAILKASIVEGTYTFNVPYSGWLRVEPQAASKITVIHTGMAPNASICSAASISEVPRVVVSSVTSTRSRRSLRFPLVRGMYSVPDMRARSPSSPGGRWSSARSASPARRSARPRRWRTAG